MTAARLREKQARTGPRRLTGPRTGFGPETQGPAPGAAASARRPSSGRGGDSADCDSGGSLRSRCAVKAGWWADVSQSALRTKPGCCGSGPAPKGRDPRAAPLGGGAAPREETAATGAVNAAGVAPCKRWKRSVSLRVLEAGWSKRG